MTDSQERTGELRTAGRLHRTHQHRPHTTGVWSPGHHMNHTQHTPSLCLLPISKISLTLTLFYVFNDVTFITFGVSEISILHHQQVIELSFLFDDVFSISFGYYQR